MKRHSTKYPGVFYREVKRKGASGVERMYYARYKRDGRTIECKLGRQYENDLTPAKAAKLRTALIEGRKSTPQEERKKASQKVWTIAALWDDYREFKLERSTRGWKGQTTDENRYTLHLEKHFAGKRPEELVTLDVQRLISRLKQGGKKPATVRNAVELLRRIVNHGLKHGYCTTDPKRLRFDMPAVDNEVTEFLTPEQLERLLTIVEGERSWKVRGIMKLALFLGLRRGELFKLYWQDVDLDTGFLVLRDPKGSRDQRVPINGAALEVFAGLPGDRQGYVFPGRDGGPLKDMRKAFRRIANEAGLPEGFRPLHGLRHTYASMLASTGQVSMHVLQKLMTHKSQRMTQRYAHLADETLQDAANVAAKAFEMCNGKSA